MKSFALLVSYVLNPVVITAFAPYLIVYKSTHSNYYALKWELFSFFYLGIAVAFLIYGVKKGFFSDLDVSKRKERNRLYLFMGVLSIVYLWSLLYFKAPFALVIAVLCVIFGVIVMSAVNRYIKASLHLAVISAFVFSLAIWYNTWFFWGIFLIPLVAWARIEIRRHTLPETIVGSMIGMSLTVLTYVIVEYIRT